MDVAKEKQKLESKQARLQIAFWSGAIGYWLLTLWGVVALAGDNAGIGDIRLLLLAASVLGGVLSIPWLQYWLQKLNLGRYEHETYHLGLPYGPGAVVPVLLGVLILLEFSFLGLDLSLGTWLALAVILFGIVYGFLGFKWTYAVDTRGDFRPLNRFGATSMGILYTICVLMLLSLWGWEFLANMPMYFA